MLNNFTFSQFIFEVEPLNRITLPDFPGSTFRGGFGHVFKKVVCAYKGQECDECLLRKTCVYSYVFETPPKDETEMMRKYNRVPNPFVIEPFPDSKQVYLSGDLLRFRVILIGKAIQHFPYFVYAFRELGKRGIGKERGHYILRNVFSEKLDGRKRQIYHCKAKDLKTPYKEISGKKLLQTFSAPDDILKCFFISPTRIQYDGSISTKIDFHILIRNLLRRISLLSYFHCDLKLDIDFSMLIEKAQSIKTTQHELEWYNWTRYSSRQKKRMNLGGLVGTVVYQGDFQDFLQYLLCGQYIHVGKNATFGLGKYIIQC